MCVLVCVSQSVCLRVYVPECVSQCVSQCVCLIVCASKYMSQSVCLRGWLFTFDWLLQCSTELRQNHPKFLSTNTVKICRKVA